MNKEIIVVCNEIDSGIIVLWYLKNDSVMNIFIVRIIFSICINDLCKSYLKFLSLYVSKNSTHNKL